MVLDWLLRFALFGVLSEVLSLAVSKILTDQSVGAKVTSLQTMPVIVSVNNSVRNI